MIRFAEPAFLWLLLLLPLVWAMGRSLRLVAPWRRLGILAVRTLLLVLIIFALARVEVRRPSRELATFFLLDYSDSISRDMQEEKLQWLDDLSRKAGRNDKTGVIVFGTRPSIETSPAQYYDFEGRILSQVEGTRTDIGAAIRLALAAFPADHMKRIVLMSDGNENLGSAMEAARFARNSGVPIDVIPVSYDQYNDVRVRSIAVPPQTSRDAPFDVRVFLESDENTEGTFRLFRDGELVVEEEVAIRAGRNAPLVVPQRLTEGGFHTYTATIDVPGDLRPQNNRAHGFTYLRGEPRVLLVDGGDSPDAIAFLGAALRSENIQLDSAGPEALPISLDELQRYDSLILSDLRADAMSQAQMNMIERAVHDLGIGLVMIGGENAFGAGGYIDSPIEKALPVSMDIKQQKMLPNGALVIVLHTCEIPDGNAWAREISLASLNVLSAQDYFGLVYFGWERNNWGEQWAWDPPVSLAGDKRMMRNRVRTIQPGDMPNFEPPLRMAAEELEKVTAQTKHIVVISDGDPAPPSQQTINRIRDAGITVSAVAIFPHTGLTVDTLQHMAYWGGGEFYYPMTADELPRIFTKEAVVVRRSLIREETFVPRLDAYSEVLHGFRNFPQLDGYVVTTLKDLATQALVTEWDDPLMAHWRYGLGKSVAFTSDAKTRWAPQWLSWGSFAAFWAQTIRWSLRETNSPNYQLNTEISGGTGRVTVDAMDDDGNFLNFLDFDASVIGPDFESRPLHVRQVAPGRYEATFPATQVGTYMLSMATEREDQDPQFLTAGVSLSYSPEYETSSSADEFLERVAESSGGRSVMVDQLPRYNPYTRDMIPAHRPTPIWPLLLLLGTLMLPADIFLRRVYLNWAEVGAWVRDRFFGFLPRRESKEAYEVRIDTLRAAKRRATAEREEERREREARAAFRERLLQEEASAGDRESVFEEPGGPDRSAARRPAKETVTGEEPGARPSAGGEALTSLMEAKKRAQQRRRK